MKVTAVIMAGGKGERFWPKSRCNLPKQFLSLSNDGYTMIQRTVERHRSIVNYDDIFVVTNQDYVGIVQEQLPDIPAENILAEPMMRNTAPCIGLAAAVISKKYADAVMLVLAADHLITNEYLYLDVLLQAIEVASEDANLVTIGITPSHPDTGYGYINFGCKTVEGKANGAYAVKKFVEKPNLEKAKEYLASGDYLWNSGMFVWKTSAILEKYRTLLPEIYDGLMQIQASYGTDSYEKTLVRCFSSFPSISVDYGIMERTSDIYTIPGNFGWDDVGSWLALERINRTNDFGNMVQGDVITIGTKNCIIVGNEKLIAAVGIEDVIVVDTPDALLICAKDDTADVKKVLENLRICNRNELL